MLKKLLLTMILCVLLVPVRVNAAEVVSGRNGNVQEYEITRADELVTYFRTDDRGITQYRRWNKTRECWYDPDWIDAE